MSFITPSIASCVLHLHDDGVPLREIARRMELAPATIFRIIHGQAVTKVYKRCPECGALLKGKTCRYCEMRQLFAPLLTTENSVLKLELRPAEYERYLVVRRQAEERRERELRNQELVEDRMRLENDRRRRTTNHKKVSKAERL